MLLNAVINNTHKDFVNSYFSLFFKIEDFDDSDTAVSKLTGGYNNPKNKIKTYMFSVNDGFESIIDDYNDIILPMYDPNKLSDAIKILSVIIVEDKDIKDDTVVDIISGLKKRELTEKAVNPSEFLMGLFLYVIRYTDNRKARGFVKNTVQEYTEKAADYVFENVPSEAQNVSDNDIREQEISIYKEQAEQKAISFCQKYDSVKDLIPLCQIAAVTNPAKKHCRKMFNEYCRCERSAQKKILEINEIHVIDVNDNDWWEECIDKFCQDYKKYDLGENRYLYSFNQYFHRLNNYAGEPISAHLECVFQPTVINPILFGNHKLDIPDLVDEYIYFKDNDKYKKDLEPPMDFLWRELDLGSCDESRLVIVLALFIIGACSSIPHENGVVIGKPSLQNIKTAEDLFYLTLLFLYEKYVIN